MAPVKLNPTEFISGTFSVIFVVTSIVLGITMISRYSKYKDKAFIYIGLAAAGISCPWWPSSVSFISILLTQHPISEQWYYFIGNAFAPFFTYSWVVAMNLLLFDGKNKKLLIIYAIIFTIFEIVFFLFLFLDPSLLGELDEKHLDVTYRFIVMGLLILIVITVCSTGLLVGFRSIKSTTPEINLKGKILIIAFLSWSVSASIDAAVGLPNIAAVVIVRTILINSSFLYYLGFVLPESAKKLFIKLRILKIE